MCLQSVHTITRMMVWSRRSGEKGIYVLVFKIATTRDRGTSQPPLQRGILTGHMTHIAQFADYSPLPLSCCIKRSDAKNCAGKTRRDQELYLTESWPMLPAPIRRRLSSFEKAFCGTKKPDQINVQLVR